MQTKQIQRVGVISSHDFIRLMTEFDGDLSHLSYEVTEGISVSALLKEFHAHTKLPIKISEINTGRGIFRKEFILSEIIIGGEKIEIKKIDISRSIFMITPSIFQNVGNKPILYDGGWISYIAEETLTRMGRVIPSEE